MTAKGERRAIAGTVAALSIVVLAVMADGRWTMRPGNVVDASTRTVPTNAPPAGSTGGLPTEVGDEPVRPGGRAGTDLGGDGDGDGHTDAGTEAGASDNESTGNASSTDEQQSGGDGSSDEVGSGRRAAQPEAHPAPPDLAPAGPSTDRAGDRDDAASTALRFVYFVEADQEHDPEARGLIEEQARRLQEFWYEQFGGTFRLAEPVVDVVFGARDAAWYDETPVGDDERWYRLTNIRTEVQVELGLDPDEDTRVVTYPAARIDGRVGAHRYDGAWMDGDDITCIAGAIATTPYSIDYPANCLATVAHELGHVYGLGHEGEKTGCMQFGFYQHVMGSELCSFSDEDRRAVGADSRNATWLDAEPGDQVQSG
jgi:hypothetical protein